MPWKDPERRRTYRLSAEAKSVRSVARKRRYDENRRRLLDLKATLSCKCGENHPACLDFHHRDPAQKQMKIALMIGKYPWERVLAEIAKCDVLCANCHRKLHDDA